MILPNKGNNSKKTKKKLIKVSKGGFNGEAETTGSKGYIG